MADFMIHPRVTWRELEAKGILTVQGEAWREGVARLKEADRKKELAEKSSSESTRTP